MNLSNARQILCPSVVASPLDFTSALYGGTIGRDRMILKDCYFSTAEWAKTQSAR